MGDKVLELISLQLSLLDSISAEYHMILSCHEGRFRLYDFSISFVLCHLSLHNNVQYGTDSISRRSPFPFPMDLPPLPLFPLHFKFYLVYFA